MPSPLCIRYGFRAPQPGGKIVTPTRRTTAAIADVCAAVQAGRDVDELIGPDLYLGNDGDAHVDERFAYVRIEIHEVTPEEMDEIGDARRSD